MSEPVAQLHAWLTEWGYDLPELIDTTRIEVTADAGEPWPWPQVKVSVIPHER